MTALLSSTRLPDLVRRTSDCRGFFTADGIYARRSCLSIIYNCACIGGPCAARSPSSRQGVLVPKDFLGVSADPDRLEAVHHRFFCTDRIFNTAFVSNQSSRTSITLTCLSVLRVPHRDPVLVHDRFLKLFGDNSTLQFCAAETFRGNLFLYLCPG